MNRRSRIVTIILIVALALGAGLIVAQDARGRSAADSAWEHSGFGLPEADILALVTDATGLEPDELMSALSGGTTLADLITANGGDVDAFIAQVTDTLGARIDEAVAAGQLTEERAARLKTGIAAEIGTLVNADPSEMLGQDRGPRGFHNFGPGKGPRDFDNFGPDAGMELAEADILALVSGATGLDPDELMTALSSGDTTLADLIAANDGDVDAFIAQATDTIGARIDEAVAAGQLTEERAARMKTAIAAEIGTLVNADPSEMLGQGRAPHDFDNFGPGMGKGMGPGGFGLPEADILALVTGATGLEPDELMTALSAGSSVADLITANDGDVDAFIAQATDTIGARIDEAVAAGQLTEERAARMKTAIAAEIETLVTADPSEMLGQGRAPHDFDNFGPGMGKGMGPGGFGLPEADILALVTGATGLEPDELMTALSAGSSVADLITANDGDVDAFIAQATDTIGARIDEAVAAGQLTAERAARLKTGIAAEIETMAHADPSEMRGGRAWRKPADMGAKRSGAGGAGEESGATLSLDDNFDFVRNGVRLQMSWDAAANAFTGTVENTTASAIQAVRVEVHLSSGVELGPTTPGDLAPGESRAVQLSAAGVTGFDGWTPHSESGTSEHSGAESGGEHGAEGEGASESAND